MSVLRVGERNHMPLQLQLQLLQDFLPWHGSFRIFTLYVLHLIIMQHILGLHTGDEVRDEAEEEMSLLVYSYLQSI